MQNNLQDVKRRFRLLDYLLRRNWVGRSIGTRQEFVGLCPLHRESRPSFYVNAAKDVFYCHGCGRGGDLIRFVQLSLHLTFQESLAHLQQELALPEAADELLRETIGFYQRQLGQRAEAWHYLQSRGVYDPTLVRQLGIGYALGGTLRRHLTLLGYSSDFVLQLGLIDPRGHDVFYRRIVFPCFENNRPVNLYGRSLGCIAPHRFLARPKGGLFAWSTIDASHEVILVEGLFDLAVLWQAGFVNTTCAFGTHLTQAQFLQLSDRPGREVFIVFDSDANGAGQDGARSLAQRLRSAGVKVRVVDLPEGMDPNSYFVSGATPSDFDGCLRRARSL
jgi:DNA primase